MLGGRDDGLGQYLAFGGDMRSLRFKAWALAVRGGEIGV